jgi:hypothetical protein
MLALLCNCVALIAGTVVARRFEASYYAACRSGKHPLPSAAPLGLLSNKRHCTLPAQYMGSADLIACKPAQVLRWLGDWRGLSGKLHAAAALLGSRWCM